jgi:hypothetical protein
MRAVVAVVLSLGFASASAWAQDPAMEAFPLPLGASRPAESGKPLNLTPPAPAPVAPSGGCAAWDCRFRVIGTVQHNGAVEFNTNLLRW